MEKIWFIESNGTHAGPYSIDELKTDKRITPDTLVWREGFETWVPIRKVYELKDLFKDEKEPKEEEEDEESSKNKAMKQSKDEIALSFQSDVPPLLWLLIILLALSYLLYRIFVV